MALPLSGPAQRGRGVPGQYVYWICMAHPTPETLAKKADIKTPADFSRESFTELVVKVHTESGDTVEEASCFLEPHANGQPHLNDCGARADTNWSSLHRRSRERLQIQRFL